jgi:hypothetical protein
LLGCEEIGEEAFDADHVLVAFGQGANTDEYLTQMCEGLAVGQFVEGLMGEWPAAGGEISENRGNGRLVQPAVGGEGVFGGGDVVPEDLEPGVERLRWRPQQLVEALVDQAAGALARVRMVGIGAGGAGVPDLGGGAADAEGFGEGAGDDRRDAAAGRAGGGAALTGRTPRATGGAGSAAGPVLAAYGAGRGAESGAARADRAVWRAGIHQATAPAVDAGFEVRGVGDQAVRTERSALVVAGGGFPAGSAARAVKAAVSDAGAADPLSVEWFVDADDSVAAGAGGWDDSGDARGVQEVDQSQNGAKG